MLCFCGVGAPKHIVHVLLARSVSCCASSVSSLARSSSCCWSILAICAWMRLSMLRGLDTTVAARSCLLLLTHHIRGGVRMLNRLFAQLLKAGKNAKTRHQHHHKTRCNCLHTPLIVFLHPRAKQTRCKYRIEPSVQQRYAAVFMRTTHHHLKV